MRIAVIGAGITGLGAAYALRHRDVTVYEKEYRPGGHSNTLTVETSDGPVQVDTGFIVYNEKNYYHLTRLFTALGVETTATDMSFAVSLDRGRLEYSGGTLLGLIAQPLNLLKPSYLGMIRDILRFYREANALLTSPAPDQKLTLGEFLARGRYGKAFIHDHLLPMGAAIWSAPLAKMSDFPMVSFARFFANHGLLQVNDRPQWRTVTGGSQTYVRRLARTLPHGVMAGCGAVQVRRKGGMVEVTDDQGETRLFDEVIFACHADETLKLLADADAGEKNILGAFKFQPNRAYLHSDAGQMPRRRAAWSSWNYLAEGDRAQDGAVAVTYWMNKLQPLPTRQDLFVTLNPLEVPRSEKIHAVINYDHPLFNRSTLAAQQEIARMQGVGGLWFAGAWMGYGFHEDGLKAGLSAAMALGGSVPWDWGGLEPAALTATPATAA